MSNRFQDRKHLEWVRTLPCLICKAGYYCHSKEVQAHHLMMSFSFLLALDCQIHLVKNGQKNYTKINPGNLKKMTMVYPFNYSIKGLHLYENSDIIVV